MYLNRDLLDKKIQIIGSTRKKIKVRVDYKIITNSRIKIVATKKEKTSGMQCTCVFHRVARERRPIFSEEKVYTMERTKTPRRQYYQHTSLDTNPADHAPSRTKTTMKGFKYRHCRECFHQVIQHIHGVFSLRRRSNLSSSRNEQTMLICERIVHSRICMLG